MAEIPKAQDTPMSPVEAGQWAQAGLTNANAELQHQLAEAQRLKNRENNLDFWDKFDDNNRASILEQSADAEERALALGDAIQGSY